MNQKNRFPEKLTGSTQRLLNTFLKNSIPCEVVYGDLNIIRYKTKSGEWRLLKAMVSEKLPLFSQKICDDKWWTARLFDDLGLTSPETILVANPIEITEFLSKYPQVVIKPRSGAHGHGISMNVTVQTNLDTPIGVARKYSKSLIAQQQIVGTDIRMLAVGGKVVSALERKPAQVTGDGVHSIAELIALENKKPERGKLGIDTLIKISLEASEQFLTPEQFEHVPNLGETVRVVGPTNQSMGGTVHDMSNHIPSRVREDAEKLVRHLDMPIAGVDCILTEDDHYFLEINASPGIAIHDDPGLGIESGCFKAYAQLLYDDEWWRDK